MDENFEAFLCHNSICKKKIKRIAMNLRARGIRVWLDEWELRPGVPWQSIIEETIDRIRAAVVFVGPDGIGPWQDQEINAFLREFARRGCPVIPVLLPGCTAIGSLPVFLRAMTIVDFNKADPEPYEALIWGITGRKPAFRGAIDG
jgi:hypothetical protein